MLEVGYTVTLDDDPVVQCLIESACGIPTIRFGSVKELAAKVQELSPDAVFVDIHLNDECSGLDAIPLIKNHWRFVPVIVMTADSSDERLGEALASGADDFIRKPINPMEILARVQARMKEQAKRLAVAQRQIGDIKVDNVHNILGGQKRERHLSKADLQLFLALADAHGTIVPRDALKRMGWGTIKITDKALDRKIHLIRDALNDVSQNLHIEAVYGKGFRLGSLGPSSGDLKGEIELQNSAKGSL